MRCACRCRGGPARLKVIGTSPAGHGFRGQRQARRSGAHLHRRTGAQGRRYRRHPGEHRRATATPSSSTRPPAPARHIRRAGPRLRSAARCCSRPACASTTARDRPRRRDELRRACRSAQRPRVAIFTTGDELVRAGGKPRADQIISSNSFALAAFVRRFGGEPRSISASSPTRSPRSDARHPQGGRRRHPGDDRRRLGRRPRSRPARRSSEAGIKLDFWKIAMRPGKPLMFARATGRRDSRPARQSRLRARLLRGFSSSPCSTPCSACRRKTPITRAGSAAPLAAK